MGVNENKNKANHIFQGSSNLPDSDDARTLALDKVLDILQVHAASDRLRSSSKLTICENNTFFFNTAFWESQMEEEELFGTTSKKGLVLVGFCLVILSSSLSSSLGTWK